MEMQSLSLVLGRPIITHCKPKVISGERNTLGYFLVSCLESDISAVTPEYCSVIKLMYGNF